MKHRRREATMSIQRINFLNSTKNKHNFLPAILIAILSIGVLLCFIVTSLFIESYQLYAYKTLKNAEKNRVTAQSDLVKTIKMYPLFSSDIPLITRVGQYEKKLQDAKNRFTEVSHTTIRKPFSQYMRTFIEQTPDGVWLTYFRIDQDKNDISIAGYALTPLAVSLFLQALQSAEPFSESIFNLFFLKKVVDNNYVRFEIANEQLRTVQETLTAPTPSTDSKK